MPAYPSVFGQGAGTGSFPFGPANNIFGKTSGDRKLSTITIADDLVEAVAIRADYESANPLWVTRYQGLNFKIQLYYLNAGEPTVQDQIRIGLLWVNTGDPVVAIQGPAGTGDLSGVDENRVVVVKNGVAASAPMIIDDAGNILLLGEPNAGSGSYRYGPLLTSNSFGFFTLTNRVNGSTFYALDQLVPSNGLSISNLEVTASYERTEVIPAEPATTQEVEIARYLEGTAIILLFEPDIIRVPGDNAKVVIHTSTSNINTDYTFNDLFGASDDGHLSILAASGQPSNWYDWDKFTPSEELISQFKNRMTLPYLGWFTEKFTNSTIANFSTRLTVFDSKGDPVDVGG